MALVYNPEGVMIEKSANPNVGLRYLSHYKRVTALNQNTTLIRFTVSGNSQNVFLGLHMRFSSDRQAVGNNNGSYGHWRFAAFSCNSSGVMTLNYEGFWNSEWGGGGAFPEMVVASNYVDARVYIWNEVQDCFMPMQAYCSDWSKVTITYY
jgi:hypothetical protein